MDDGQEVVVMLNGNGQEDERLNSSWESNLLFNDPIESVNEENETVQQNETVQPGPSLDENKDNYESIEKDLAFLKKHATNADPDFLHSLLLSQGDNPNRLETTMSEMLNIPNAIELIEEYRKNSLKIGDKRPTNNIESGLGESKKKKSEDSDCYLNKIREMFPDADDLFLIRECQQLGSWEDCTRFINTVMISGVYAKKNGTGFTSETPKREPFFSYSIYRNVTDTLSSEEEVSSSGLSESPKQKRRLKKSSNSGSSTDSSPHFWSETIPNQVLRDIEIVDLVSDNTEPYDPPDEQSLQEIYSSNLGNNMMEIDNAVAPPWEVQLEDDVDNILEKKFGRKSQRNGEVSFLDTPESPKAGPSGLQTRNSPPKTSLGSFSSSHAHDLSLAEKSLAEIIERHRRERQKSIDSDKNLTEDFQKPSTSKEGLNHPSLQNVLASGSGESSDVVSSPEVSTTSQQVKTRNGSGSWESSALEEVDESSKVSEEWLDEQTANLIRIFPNTDPLYLRNVVANMNGTSEEINEFVVSKLEKNDMPTRAEYEKRLELQELQNRYTKNFSIEDFLKAVPDPWKYFSNGNRDCKKYKEHSLCYLKSAFRKHYVRDILDTFAKNHSNLYVTYKQLKKFGMKRRTSRRSEFECNNSRPTTIDIQFLQEVAFIENEEKIMEHLKNEKIARQIKFDEAKRTGRLLECQCCFDSEVMVEDIIYCPKDHFFCKECIVKSVEVEMGKGKCQFECLTNCDEKFSLASLQSALKPELFSKVIQAIQMEEIRAAEIEDLVQCPFCNYATIMPPEEKVMTCLNPECLKQSCRLCKELNHVPLRCDEVEKSEEVKMRTYIENKMTEALVRTCYKCGKKFVKEDGCNKMTCTCGAKICYICRKPVTGYSHFNAQGGTEYHKCPLYSTNDELHVDLVKKVGEEAKAEVMQANPQTKLLHDPTTIMPERTHDRPMPGMRNGAGLNAGLRALRAMYGREGSGSEEEENHEELQPAVERANNRNRRRRQRIQSESEDDDYDHDHHHRHGNHRNHNNPRRNQQWEVENRQFWEENGVNLFIHRGHNHNHNFIYNHHYHHNHNHHRNRHLLP